MSDGQDEALSTVTTSIPQTTQPSQPLDQQQKPCPHPDTPLKPTQTPSNIPSKTTETAKSEAISTGDVSSSSPTKEFKKPAGVVAPAMKPTATISPVVNVTQHQV